MNTHLKGFGLENFRVFKDHTYFDFAPITVLTGPNNSGKSSLNKALLLLKDSIDSVGQKAGQLDFRKSETIHQLGGYERIISDEKKNILRFSLPYTLSNYPTIGAETTAQISFEYTIVSMVKISISLNNEMLLYRDAEKLVIDMGVFTKHLYLSDSISVIETGDIKRGILKIFSGVIGDGKFCIVDMSKPSHRDIKIYDKEIGDVNSGEPISFTELILSANQEELEAIVAWYKEKSTGIKEQELFYLVSDTFFDPIAKQTFDVGNHAEYIDQPFEQLLEQFALKKHIIKFIQDKIIRFKDFNSLSSIINALTNVQYLESIKGKTKRIYRREEDDVLNVLISSFLLNKDNQEKRKSFLQKWSDIEHFNFVGEIKPLFDAKNNFHSIEIGEFSLIEQGFGISQLTALLLGISNCKSGSIVILEEPEANLHPNFQSKLADMLVDATETFDMQFIVETHSEYLIRKLQYLTAKKTIKPEDTVIYYFHNPNHVPMGEKQVKKIEIQEDGSLSSDFGSGFFDEADNLAISLFNLKNQKN